MGKKKKSRSVEELLLNMKGIIDSLQGDAESTDNGNRSAGRRVRKGMQEVKALAQDIRVTVLEKR